MSVEEKIENCKSIDELNALRLEIINATHSGNPHDLYVSNDATRARALQKQFIKKMNKLKRIPWRDRI